jgi:ferric-dicitrate binding protein FerR (iron transport regulator)/sugar lactone lactonase YvrE
MKPASDADLLQAYLDGELPPGEVPTLEGRLKAEPDLARVLLRLAREEAMLREWACAQPAVAEAQAPRPATVPLPGRPGPWRRGGVAAAALLLAALGAYLLLPAPEGPALPRAAGPLAKLDEVQGEVYLVTKDGDTPARAGQGLFPGQKLSTRGDDSFAVIRYADATRLELGADTTLSFLRDARRVYLAEGLLSAEVPRPAGPPLVLATPHAEVSALASKLSFLSGSYGTRIESEGGPIQLKRRSDGQSVEVQRGWYAVASLDPAPLVSRALPTLVTQARAVLDEGSGPVVAAAFSPDGRTLFTGGWKGEVKAWDAASGELVRSFRAHPNSARVLVLSPDGNLLATAGDDRLVKLWDPATGGERAALKHRQNPPCLAISPDGKLLAVPGIRSRGVAEVKLWDLTTLQERAALLGHVQEVRSLDFSPDGALLAAGARDGTVKLWRLDTFEEVRTLAGTGTEAAALKFSPDGQTLAIGSRDGAVLLWDTVAWEARRLDEAHPRGVRCVAFSPDGRALATAGNDAAVRLWDVAAGAPRLTLKGHRNNQVGVAVFSPDGRTLATGGGDRTVRLWQLSRTDPLLPPLLGKI